ncbi:hypothetical protein HK101_005797 [Irineochytrium annulatum]|nr:hypothetical protein HK101_005797 [Irineochytrium annulatum]
MGLHAELIDPSGAVVGEAFVGSRRWVVERNGCRAGLEGDLDHRTEMWQGEGATVVFVGVRIDKYAADESRSRVVAILAVSDPVRPSTREAITKLRAMGVRVVMMTGDHVKTAVAVASEVGMPASDVIAGCLPEDKGTRVVELCQAARNGKDQRGRRKVAFAGDGINDSVALASADVGIALGTGSDIAIESASAVLLRSDLVDIPILLRLSRRVMSRIRLNLFAALAYNVLGIPIAAGVLYPFLGVRLEPWMAGMAMAMSSVSVVASSLAIKGFRA